MTATTSGATRRLGTAPDTALLDPAERLGIDELRPLQLERLQRALRRIPDAVRQLDERVRAAAREGNPV